MPQLRMLDGVEITSEEKVKAENLHGFDLQDRQIIFKSLLPEEKFVDRRIFAIEDVNAESDSENEYLVQEKIATASDQALPPSHEASGLGQAPSSSVNSTRNYGSLAKQYVGELISRVDFNGGDNKSPRFIQHSDV